MKKTAKKRKKGGFSLAALAEKLRGVLKDRKKATLLTGAVVIVLLFILDGTLLLQRGAPSDGVAAPPDALPDASAEAASATPAPVLTPTPAPRVPATDLTPWMEGGVALTGESVPKAMPYQICISKKTFTVAVLGIDSEGNYTRLMRAWRAAIGTGNKTRAGTYTLGKKYEWYHWSEGGYTPYTSAMTDSKIRIHGPLHNKQNFESLYVKGYQQIGTAATQGCIRTTTAGAAWMFYNCLSGTKLVVVNDALYESEDPPAIDKSAKSDPTRPLSMEEIEIPVTFFTVAEAPLTLRPGETARLTVQKVTPENKTTGQFVYVSDDENVATVSVNGQVTAVRPGAARILVKADDIYGAYRLVDVTVSE